VCRLGSAVGRVPLTLRGDFVSVATIAPLLCAPAADASCTRVSAVRLHDSPAKRQMAQSKSRRRGRPSRSRKGEEVRSVHECARKEHGQAHVPLQPIFAVIAVGADPAPESPGRRQPRLPLARSCSWSSARGGSSGGTQQQGAHGRGRSEPTSWQKKGYDSARASRWRETPKEKRKAVRLCPTSTAMSKSHAIALMARATDVRTEKPRLDAPLCGAITPPRLSITSRRGGDTD